MKKGEEFTTWDVFKSLGIHRECIREWLQRGFVKASAKKADGIGTKNLFNRWDLYMVALFQHLVLSGLSREVASRVLKRINEDVECWIKRERKDSLPLPHLIVIENIKDPRPRAVVSMGDSNAIELPKDADIDDLLIINFGKIKKRVDTRID
jgi:hypothetical protein